MLLVEEVRYALRTLRRSGSFTTIAVLALALGIGANAAIFSLVDALLIRPLPLRDPDRLVEVWEDASHLGFAHDTPAPANYIDWKSRNHVFTDMAALSGNLFALTGDGAPEQVQGTPITWNLFPMLGVRPVLGRNIRADEDRPGNGAVVLLSYRLWQQRYGGDPQMVGRDVLLNATKCRVIGVMPLGFQFPDRTDVWAPMALSPEAMARRDNHFLRVYARLREDVNITDAQREMAEIGAQLEREHPDTNAQRGAAVVALRDEMLGKFDLGLRILTGGVASVLLICCANLAGLMLARTAERRRELAVRAALGANRWRLVRHGLFESLIVGFAGNALGFLFAWEVVPVIARLVPSSMAGWVQPQVNGHLLLFTSAISLATAFVFGSFPALTLRVDLADALKAGGRTISGGSGARRGLVICDVALTVVVSVGAALMVQTLWHLTHVDLGFRPHGVLTVRTSLPGGPRYRDFAPRSAFYRDVLARVRAIPGVTAAGYTTFLPLTNRGGTTEIIIEGMPPMPRDVNHRSVSSDYFRTIGTSLMAGRFFSDTDTPDSTPVAIINDAMARQFWPGHSALGARFRMNSDQQPWMTVVGVVASARQMGLDLGGRAEMYFPCTQPWGMEGFFTPRDLAIQVKGWPLDFANAVRQAIWSVDRNQPVADVQPMEQLIDTELFAQKAQVWLLGSFAALALLLAATGLYGLLSQFVVQRTRDIGLRMALGARRDQVLMAVLRQGLELVAIGLTVGTAIAAALGRVMESLLYGVEAGDLATFAFVALVMVVTGAGACLVPARRASRIDPMAALRTD